MRFMLLALLAFGSCDWRKFDDLADKTWVRRLEAPGNILGDYGARVAVVDGAVVVLAPPRGVVVRTFGPDGGEASEIALEPPPPIIAADTSRIQGIADVGGRLVMGVGDNIVVFDDPANLAGGAFLFGAPPGPAVIARHIAAVGSDDFIAVSDTNELRLVNLEGTELGMCTLGADVNALTGGSILHIATSGGLLTVDVADVTGGGPCLATTTTLDFEPTDVIVANGVPVVSGNGRAVVLAAAGPIELDDPTGNIEFGAAVAAGNFDGDADDEIVVGAPGADPAETPNAGAVFVFDADGTLLSTIHEGDPSDEQQFGKALAVLPFGGEDVLVVGANLDAFIYFQVLASGTDPRQ